MGRSVKTTPSSKPDTLGTDIVIINGTAIECEARDDPPTTKARRIKKVWQRGQREVNAWKQVITAKKVQPIFSIFTGTPLGRALAAFPIDETDHTIINKISFKDLGIKYEDLILFYMKKGLLPRNYLTLK